MQNRNVATKEFNQFVDFIAEISNPTGEGGGFPLADLNLDKIGKAMNQLGIPENELDNFLTDFKKFVDPDSGRVDTTLLKESAVDGILSGIFHQANVKSNNNKLNFTGESLKIFEEILTNDLIRMLVFWIMISGIFYLGTKLLIQIFRYLRGESTE